jgi:hypothetical protein
MRMGETRKLAAILAADAVRIAGGWIQGLD